MPDRPTSTGLGPELDAVSAARAAGDFVRETVHLHAALGIMIYGPGRLPKGSAVTVAAVDAALGTADDVERVLLLFSAAELGVALREMGHTGQGQEWLELVDAHLDTPHEDEAPLLTRLRRIVSANLVAHYRNRGEDDTAQWPEAVAHHDMPDPQVEGTLAVLVNATQQARRLALEGERDKALALLQGAIAELDHSEPGASDWARLAATEMDELAAPSPQEARRAVHRRAALLAGMGAPPLSRAMVWTLAAGHAWKAGRRDHALRDAAEALRLCAEPGAGDMTWRVFGAVAEMETGFGRTRSAVLLDKVAVTLLCDQRRHLADFDPALRMLEDSGREVLDRLAGRLVSAGRLLEAEEVSMLRGARGASQVSPPSLTPAEAETTARLLQTCTGAGGSLRFVLDGLEREGESWEAASTCGDQQAAWLQVDDEGTLSLSYVVQAGRVVCLARRGGGTRAFPLDLLLEEANQIAFRVRQRVADLRSDPVPVLQEAYDLLLRQPAEAMGAGSPRIRVAAAPGALRVLPWAALHDGRRHAVQRWAWLRAAPGVDVLRRPTLAARLLACAATGAGAGFPALGAVAAEEAEAVARAWAVTPGQAVLRDGAFTRASLAIAVPDTSILHVASHFAPDPVQLGRSRLLLGDGSVLALADLAGMGLSRLDLVVLSACGTAMATVEPDAAGEGASAVDAMLLAGGARAAVGTLWPVDSDATRALMTVFHAGLRRGLDKAEALAHAQRGLLAGGCGDGGWMHPFFWAAPVLSGNWLGWKLADPDAGTNAVSTLDAAGAGVGAARRLG